MCHGNHKGKNHVGITQKNMIKKSKYTDTIKTSKHTKSLHGKKQRNSEFMKQPEKKLTKWQ